VDEALQFDPLTCAWQSLGNTEQVKKNEADEELLGALEDIGKATIATISKTIGKDFSNTRRRLLGLWTGGKIRREEIENKTYYFLPRKETEK